MEEKTELNDIILNKGSGSGSSKKVLLIIASLGIVLVLVVLIANMFNAQPNNLPQAALPPEPAAQATKEEPLFEPVEVENAPQANNALDEVAQRIKEQSEQEDDLTSNVTPSVKKQPAQKTEPKAKSQPVKTTSKPVAKKPVTKKSVTPTATAGHYYVQVGSFVKYQPNKRFLAIIKSEGFNYIYRKVTINNRKINKVLIGPFSSEKAARAALPKIRANIERGAFITKVR